MMRALLLSLLLVALAPGLFAHEVRPAYLELRQRGPETYDVLWKVPGLGQDLRLGLYVELPAGCTNLTEPRASMINNAFTERWSVTCAGGLAGGTIRIAGCAARVGCGAYLCRARDRAHPHGHRSPALRAGLAPHHARRLATGEDRDRL